MKTPEEKLCSRTWRLTRSSWLLLSILSFGFLTWAGFAVIGGTLRRKVWIASAVAWFIAGTALSIFMASVDTGTKENPIVTPASTIMGWIFFAFWVGGITHSALSNRSWLRGLAHRRAPVAWYAAGAPTAGSTSPVREDRSSARSLDEALSQQRLQQPVGRSQSGAYPSPPTASDRNVPSPLDINTASSEDFQRELGFDQAWGDWLVSTRNRIGAYSSTQQLLTEAQVPPHLFVTMQHRITAQTRPIPQVPPAHRRRLDL